MQSYGIIGITLWRNDSVSTGKRQYPYLETVVSRLRNSRFLPWNTKKHFAVTAIDRYGNESTETQEQTDQQ